MLLALDTASPTVTVALADVDAAGGETGGPEGVAVLAARVCAEPLRHAEQTAPLVEQALAAAGVDRLDVTAIAVGVGPGPFTGLRVGLMTARTLGHVWEVPVYGVCSLDVLAAQAVAEQQVRSPFLVATDARRREVYLASYDADGVRLGGPTVARPADVTTGAPVVGEGALLYPEAFGDPRPPVRPSAGWLAGVVAAERAEILDPEPLYLRRPDAVALGAAAR